ncbi:NAD(P)H-binding protein [Corynebacterium striatum]|uniref:NAD(P)H-binding protein n=1 Tax=Corynebacterium striatum TaxID=43770 RepID=UPI00341219B2
MTTVKKVLYIGGHGKIGLLSAPLISEKGYEIHSLVRNPDQAPEIEKLGATPVIKDITELSVDEWADLLTLYDVVVWGAGNGGRGEQSSQLLWIAMARLPRSTHSSSSKQLASPPRSTW